MQLFVGENILHIILIFPKDYCYKRPFSGGGVAVGKGSILHGIYFPTKHRTCLNVEPIKNVTKVDESPNIFKDVIKKP